MVLLGQLACELMAELKLIDTLETGEGKRVMI